MHSLHCGGDVQSSEAWRGKLAGVDVGDLGHGCVDAVNILPFHHQHRLGRVKMELDRYTNTFTVRLWWTCCNSMT